MTEKTKYWIWLQKCLGTDSRKLLPAMEKFRDAEGIFRCDEQDLRESGIFSDSETKKLVDKDMEYSEKIIERCRELGINACGYGEYGYPERLCAIPTPPVVIYTAGSLPSEQELHVAVVGTRNPDESGKKLSYNFAYDLACKNKVVVSGGALGVDIFAHKGCIDAEGITLCVIACGIDKFSGSVAPFLLDNVTLRGAIISEYPPGYPPTKFTFPKRDRIISGLSDTTLVVQAGMGSGALITVKYAIEQKRKVFAVPGDCGNIFTTGTNFLIRSGFTAALSYKDILSYYSGRSLPAFGDDSVSPELPDGFFKKLAVKAEDYLLPSYEGRKLAVPAGYSFFSDDIGVDKENIIMEEQLLIPLGEETSVPENSVENDHVLPEKTVEEILPRKTDNDDGDEGQQGGFVSLELFSGREKIYPSTTEDEMKMLRALQRRAINEEPEPRGSYIYDLCRETSASMEYVRVMEIDRLTKRLNMGEGIRKIRWDIDSMFGNAGKIYDDTEAPSGTVAVPDLNDFDENEEIVKPQKIKNKSRQVKKGNDKKQNQQKSNLIIEQKAEPVETQAKKTKKISSEQLTENACSVYDTISETPIHVDTIKLQTGLGIGSVLSALTELQISGLVRRLPGSRYVRI